jgi:DNA-binding NarL/FixJ family response regulator
MRVLLADDESKVRSAIRLVLEQEPGLVMVGEAIDGAGLLAEAARSKPELVLLDWELPGPSAIQLVRSLKLSAPEIKVIALSGRPEAGTHAAQAGVAGFVCKGDPPERLLAAVRAVSARKTPHA